MSVNYLDGVSDGDGFAKVWDAALQVRAERAEQYAAEAWRTAYWRGFYVGLAIASAPLLVTLLIYVRW